MTTDGTPRQVPTAEEEAQARAYLSGIAYGFGILFEHWTGWGDGTATALDGEGTRLIYTGDELHPFDAVIPCNRHRRHRVGVTWPKQLDKARADTAACSAKADVQADQVDPTDPPTMAIPRLRPVVTPSPLWLITRAADTPGSDRQKHA